MFCKPSSDCASVCICRTGPARPSHFCEAFACSSACSLDERCRFFGYGKAIDTSLYSISIQLEGKKYSNHAGKDPRALFPRCAFFETCRDRRPYPHLVPARVPGVSERQRVSPSKGKATSMSTRPVESITNSHCDDDLPSWISLRSSKAEEVRTELRCSFKPNPAGTQGIFYGACLLLRVATAVAERCIRFVCQVHPPDQHCSHQRQDILVVLVKLQSGVPYSFG